MRNNKLQFENTKEFFTEKFRIRLKLGEKGSIEGTFTNKCGVRPQLYQITNGLFLKKSNKTLFVFFIDWVETKKFRAVTSFSGYYLEDISIPDSYRIEWLLTYEDLININTYSKKGYFSSETNFDSLDELPYPTMTFPFMHG